MNNKRWRVFLKGMILGVLCSCIGLNAMNHSEEDVESGIAVKRARINEDEPTVGVAEQDKAEANRKREWPEEDGARIDKEDNQKKIREDEKERVARLFAAVKQGTLLAEDVRSTDFIPDGVGFTLLNSAAMSGQRRVVEILLDKAADEKGSVSEEALDGALYQAVEAGHKHVVDLLLDRGAQIDCADGNGTTMLHYAAEAGNREVVELLVSRGAKIDTVESCIGAPPLHWAAEEGHREVVELLLDKGAKVDLVDNGGWTALHYAAKYERKEVVELLLNRGSQIDAMTKNGATSLHYAFQSGRREMIELLIGMGAKVDAVTHNGSTMLHFAADNGHREVIELLLDRGATIDAVAADGRTALHCAATYGYENVVKLLLDRGAQIGAVTVNGDTAFSCATRNGHKKVVELLIGRGVLVDAVTLGGWTALHWAAYNGRREVAELLLNRGAQMGAVNGLGETALCCAAAGGNREVVELLVGCMMVRPSDEQVVLARDQIRKILLWEKKGRKVLHTRMPKDVLKYTILLDELLCRNLAIILLKKVDRGLKIDACFTSKRVLLCAAQMILHGNGALLENAYSKLPNGSELKSLFAPHLCERNFAGCLIKALAEKIQQNNKKCASIS